MTQKLLFFHVKQEPHLGGAAVLMPGALRVAPGVRVAQEVLGAGALGAVVPRGAVGVLTAR